MALQIWLPLTKDLRNQGLSNVTVMNNGATFNSAGKLGGCYSFGTGDSYITVDSTPLKTFTEFSFACWVKIISWNTSYSTVFAAKNGTSVGWTNLIFALLRNSSNSTLCFNIADGSSHTTTTNCQTGTLSLNTWYHIVCTYKSGEIRLYQDGDVVSTFKTTVTPNFNSIVNLWIGKSNTNSYQSNNLLNDVRIYDHCLSPMEVKQLSQGLVLHYPLNRGGWGQENLLPNTNEGTTGWNWTMQVGDYTKVEETALSGVRGCKFTRGATAQSGWSVIYYDLINENVFKASTNYTLSVDIYPSISTYLDVSIRESNGTNVVCNNAGSQAISANKWNHMIFHLTSVTTLPSSTGETIYFTGISPAVGNSYIFRNLKLEEGSIATPWCPNSSDALATTIGLNGTTEYDTSGYCNNGTRTGTFNWTSDTPKYQVSTSLSNNASKLHISGLSTSGFGNSYSIAWWGKTNSFSGLMQWGFSDGIRLNGIFNGNLWNTGDSANNPLYIPGTTTQVTVPTTNVWHHFVMTGDGTTCKVYKDGELWGQAKTYKAISGTSIYFNGWDSSTSYSNNNGYSMSDFRIYATALSADDVKSLYQNCATIDPDGTIRGKIR